MRHTLSIYSLIIKLAFIFILPSETYVEHLIYIKKKMHTAMSRSKICHRNNLRNNNKLQQHSKILHITHFCNSRFAKRKELVSLGCELKSMPKRVI